MSKVDFNHHIIKDSTSSSGNISFQHTKSIYDMKWNCDGSYLCTISSDKSVKVAQLLPSQSGDKENTVFSSIKVKSNLYCNYRIFTIANSQYPNYHPHVTIMLASFRTKSICFLWR